VARAGLIEIHAFALMRNHFHILVSSTGGNLAEALKLLQNRYSRYLNRRIQRDGGLWRSRFQSKRVRGDHYRRALVSYIDSNALEAAKAVRPMDYAWGSARLFARARRPRWLTTAWVESQVRELTGRSACDTKAYLERFPVRCEPGFLEWVERRLAASRDADDDLEYLVSAEPRFVRDWLRRKSVRADGRVDPLPVATAEAVSAAIRKMQAERDRLPLQGPRRRRMLDGWILLEAGLLRDACHLAFPAIAGRIHSSRSTAHARVAAHRMAMKTDAIYAARAAECLRAAVIRTIEPGSVRRVN